MTTVNEAIQSSIDSLVEKKNALWQELEVKKAEFKTISDTILGLKRQLKEAPSVPSAPKKRSGYIRRKGPSDSEILAWIKNIEKEFTAAELASGFQMSLGWTSGPLNRFLQKGIIEIDRKDRNKVFYKYLAPVEQVSEDPEKVKKTIRKAKSSKRKKTGKLLKKSQVESYIREKKEFTNKEITEHFGRSPGWWHQVKSTYAHLFTFTAGNSKNPGKYIYKDPLPAGSLAEQQAEWDLNNGGQATISQDRPTRGTTIPGTGSNARLSSNPDVRRLIRLAEEQGARAVKNGSGHIRIIKGLGPEEMFIDISSTPSDRNSVHQAERDLKKIGINV